MRGESNGKGGGGPLSHGDPSVSLTADSSPCAGEPWEADCEASVRTGFAMTGYKKRGANPGGAM